MTYDEAVIVGLAICGAQVWMLALMITGWCVGVWMLKTIRGLFARKAVCHG